MKKRNLNVLSVIVLLALLVSLVTAAILYSRIYDSHWGVNVAFGLVLYEGSSPAGSIEWGLIPQYGDLSKNFTLVSTGNKPANVSLILPTGNGFLFTTAFIDGSIIQPYGGNYSFSITLHDIDMVTETEYSGNFTFAIIG